MERTHEEVLREMNERDAAIRRLISAELVIDQDSLRILSKIAMNEMYGLGDLEMLISDPMLEEIIINSSKTPVSVYHRSYGWMKTNIVVNTEEEIENYSAQIARKVGRQITTLNPILDAHLVTGDRANATLYPVSTAGNSLTLRLFAREPWSIVRFASEQTKSMSMDMAALLWQAVHYEMNVLVAGGTASGKTSALNSIVSLIPPYQRVVTIEDTRELVLPSYQWNWVPMATRAANPEGLGEVTMLDLVVNALRMRPDRIVMGEIRRKREAEVLFEAMHTGHSVYGTIHADTADQVIKRLLEPPIELPPAEVEDIHLLLIQYRDRRRNIRRTLELAEVMPTAKVPELNHIFKWRARTDTFENVRTPNRYIELMNLHTGFTSKEVLDDQRSKAEVLQWMDKNKMYKVDEVGRVMKSYYTDEAELVKAVEKGLKPEKVLGEVAQ
jgi:flagellar protein FlaI